MPRYTGPPDKRLKRGARGYLKSRIGHSFIHLLGHLDLTQEEEARMEKLWIDLLTDIDVHLDMDDVGKMIERKTADLLSK